MRITLVRVTPPTGPESLKPRLLQEIANEVQQRLASGRALNGEISPEFEGRMFEALVLGDGILVRAQNAPRASRLPTFDEVLYPRTSLDDPAIRDSVSAAVGESLSNLNELLTRASN